MRPRRAPPKNGLLRRGVLVGLLALICATAATSTHAQLPEELRGRPVRVIEVNGDGGLLAPNDLGLPLGSPIGRPTLRALVLRLPAEERWADVQIALAPEGDGVRLVSTLVPRLIAVRKALRPTRRSW